MTFKPTLKPSILAANQRHQDLLRAPLFCGDGAPPETSQVYVTYAIDMGDHIDCLTKDTCPELSLDKIHQQALASLRTHLASREWQIHTREPNSKTFTLAYFSDDYYAAEVLLLKERMQELHSRLGVKRLLVCTPVRGLLLAIAFDADEREMLELFTSICYQKYEESPEAERISDVIWGVVNGEVCGTVNVNSEYREWFKTSDSTSSSQPESDTATTKETRLYFPFQIALASFLGTPVAGLIAIVLNYRALGNIKSALRAFGLGVIVVIFLLALYVFVPRTPYDRLVPGLVALILAVISKNLFFNPPSSEKIQKNSIGHLLLTVAVGLMISFSLLVAIGVGFGAKL